MKIRFIALLLIAALAVSMLAGCQGADATLESAGDAVEDRVESAGENLMQTLAPTAAPEATQAPAPTAAITAEQAQSIALEHAGFTSDQVTRLHVEYEIDHGVPHYDVEFHEGQWEYDYEIHAETGEILSYEKDD